MFNKSITSKAVESGVNQASLTMKIIAQLETKMSMSQTQNNLRLLVCDKEIKVVALSGKWGTGKSHMWNDLRENSTDPAVKSALYVSLFGVTSITNLKLTLAQSALSFLPKKGPNLDRIKHTVNAAKQIGKTIFSGLSAIDEIALLTVPAFVRDKFIVVDDIERKHEKLTIDEILGFIDDFTRNYNCRILLILNSDQLTDKAVWEKFREKVIDEELRLETTPSEAFEIAKNLLQSQFSEKIKPAVERCGLTNIRIICKVIRAINTILLTRKGLTNEVLNRVIPSTALLAAIYYKGMEDGPTLDFVLNFESSLIENLELLARKNNGENMSEADEKEGRKRASWMLLLEQLGILGTDEYEKLISGYLDSGLIDRSALDSVLDRYQDEEQLAKAQVNSREFIQSTMWNPDLSNEHILKNAEELIDSITFLDCYAVTTICNCLTDFEGGEKIGLKLLNAWISEQKAKAAKPDANSNQFAIDNWVNRPVHPLIVAEFEALSNTLKKPKTLLDTCLTLAENNGWNQSEELVMKSASILDFKETILNISGKQLKIFMLKNLDICENASSYDTSFGTASAHFLEACRNILIERKGTRWASLIENLFKTSKLNKELYKELSVVNKQTN